MAYDVVLFAAFPSPFLWQPAPAAVKAEDGGHHHGKWLTGSAWAALLCFGW